MKVLDLFNWSVFPDVPNEANQPVIYKNRDGVCSVSNAYSIRSFLLRVEVREQITGFTWAYLDEPYSPDPLAGCTPSTLDEILAEGLPPHAMIYYPNQPPLYVKLEN